MRQTDLLKALAIVNIFETGKPFGEFAAVAILNDGAGISYGISQFTHRSGSLAAVVERYLELDGAVGRFVLENALPNLRRKEPVVIRAYSKDERVKKALRAAAVTREMRIAQSQIAFEKYLPEVYDLFNSQKEKFNTSEEEAALQEIYPFSTNISIDFGIMEKADNVYVIPSSFGWSDIGTWNSAYEHLSKDHNANAISSHNVMLMDASNCIVHAPESKLVVLQGLKDYIVVDTGDVLLVCKKEKEQEIKEFVGDVKRQKGEKYL